jgi:dCTP deaminase
VTVLSDADVLAARDQGRVIIHPFRREQLATSSYDVRLGEWYYREQHPHLEANLFNPLDSEHVARVWGQPQLAMRAFQQLDKPLVHVGVDDRVILLEPGETILAHTQEFIGGLVDVTTMMKARSSMGRSFITVCKCAGWGDVGYANRWTMEITNVSRYYRVPLVVGTRVAQIVFLRTGPLDGLDYTEQGAYASTGELDAMVDEWRPEMMLPKMRK